ncbi:hypothetical protein BCR32DRAFT_241359 [Anaeromyces robustus]|uniref:Uncharacterized protein n=1 Tax=Anaeromyces robustus TaxID=1754192 RepID=A0A1Y1XJS4_9FUNG|nr:hypothetical protein BCR32DRAFT_241359 [Anaeromyces robustus]|eukprot:ORX85972.1 hypothetical protein BCR32DRAFT_241359 [Anaeromyces robustus]
MNNTEGYKVKLILSYSTWVGNRIGICPIRLSYYVISSDIPRWRALNSKYRIKVKLIYPIPLGSEIGSAFALLGCPTVLSALTFLERLVLNLLNNICCLLQTTGMISFNRAADRNKNGDFE